jgi:hypothetical protein
LAVLTTLLVLVALVVDLKANPGDIYQGEPKGNKADCILTLEDADMVALVSWVNSLRIFYFGYLKLSIVSSGHW